MLPIPRAFPCRRSLYDVVIVGAGAAGVPAAISAKEAGATVALIQKEATAISQGNTATGILLDGSDPAGVSAVVTAFKKTVERYNALAAEGKDEDFGKAGKWLTTIDTPPFYDIHRKVRVSAVVSGVHVGEHMEVLKADSTEPIKGLYAIGNTAGDFYCGIDYTMWMPGLSLGRAHTQGYVVDKYVAKL